MDNGQKKQLDVDVESLKKYKIKIKNLLAAIEGTKKLIKDNPKLQKRLFDNDAVPLFLQIALFKVPSKVSKQIRRLNLKHSLFTKEAEVCLIVPDLKEIHIKEHEKHVEHYEELLKKKDVDNIKKIMTLHEFRTDYENFELRSSLVDLYDVFLVDGRISGKVVHKCGKIFYKKRKVPVPIKLQATKLKKHIEVALKKTPLFIHNKGNSLAVQFGRSNMKTSKLLENLSIVIGQLNAHLPGGMSNVSGLLINSEASTSIPIYKNLANPSEIKAEDTPVSKPKAFKNVKGELSTRTNIKVVVTPYGSVKRRKIKRRKATEVAETES